MCLVRPVLVVDLGGVPCSCSSLLDKAKRSGSFRIRYQSRESCPGRIMPDPGPLGFRGRPARMRGSVAPLAMDHHV